MDRFGYRRVLAGAGRGVFDLGQGAGDGLEKGWVRGRDVTLAGLAFRDFGYAVAVAVGDVGHAVTVEVYAKKLSDIDVERLQNAFWVCWIFVLGQRRRR